MPETFTITFEITTGPDDTGKAQLFWDEFLEDFDGGEKLSRAGGFCLVPKYYKGFDANSLRAAPK